MKLKCCKCGKDLEIDDAVIAEGQKQLDEMLALQGVVPSGEKTEITVMCKNCQRPSYIG